MATRLKVSGNTPKQEAIAIAMQAVSNATVAIDEQVNDADQPLTEAQYQGIYRELARIHNRIGARFEGDWMPLPID